MYKWTLYHHKGILAIQLLVLQWVGSTTLVPLASLRIMYPVESAASTGVNCKTLKASSYTGWLKTLDLQVYCGSRFLPASVWKWKSADLKLCLLLGEVLQPFNKRGQETRSTPAAPVLHSSAVQHTKTWNYVAYLQSSSKRKGFFPLLQVPEPNKDLKQYSNGLPHVHTHHFCLWIWTMIEISITKDKFEGKIKENKPQKHK